MPENGNIAYISTDFGHKDNNGNESIILKGRKTEIVIIIVTDIGNHWSQIPLPLYEIIDFDHLKLIHKSAAFSKAMNNLS